MVHRLDILSIFCRALTNGFVVYEGVLTEEECAATRGEVWDYLEARHAGGGGSMDGGVGAGGSRDRGGRDTGDGGSGPADAAAPAGDEVRECLKRRHANDGASSRVDGGGNGNGDEAAPALTPVAPAQRPAPVDPGPVWNGDTTVALRRDDTSTYHALSSETYGLAPEPSLFSKQLVVNRQNPRVVACMAAALGCADEDLIVSQAWGLSRTSTRPTSNRRTETARPCEQSP